MSRKDKIKQKIQEYEAKIPDSVEEYNEIERQIKLLLEQLSHLEKESS